MEIINIEEIEEKVIVGDWRDAFENIDADLNLIYRLDSINNAWDAIKQISTFLASYFSANANIKRDYNSLLFIINELIENAVKNTKVPDDQIEIETCLDKRVSLLKITNRVSEEDYKQFLDYSMKLFNQNLTEMYLRRLNKLNPGSESSGIGLIVLKKDYDINLSIRFINNGEGYQVTVYVEL